MQDNSLAHMFDTNRSSNFQENAGGHGAFQWDAVTTQLMHYCVHFAHSNPDGKGPRIDT